MLPPVGISMDGIEAYKNVSEQTFGRATRDSDNENASETPVVAYLDLLVSKFHVERIGDMTGSLWRTLEAWKLEVHDPAKELPLMYGVVERMAYVAFRPGSCSTEERSIATSLNFINCRADMERGGSELQPIAQERMGEWRIAGEALIRGESWQRAHEAGSNAVDKDVPAAADMLADTTWTDTQQRDAVESLGAMIGFVRSMFGHDSEVVDPVVRCLPYYFNRIRADLLEHGSIPVVCYGLFFSMKKGMLDGNVYGHDWAAASEALRWVMEDMPFLIKLTQETQLLRMWVNSPLLWSRLFLGNRLGCPIPCLELWMPSTQPSPCCRKIRNATVATEDRHDTVAELRSNCQV